MRNGSQNNASLRWVFCKSTLSNRSTRLSKSPSASRSRYSCAHHCDVHIARLALVLCEAIMRKPAAAHAPTFGSLCCTALPNAPSTPASSSCCADGAGNARLRSRLMATRVPSRSCLCRDTATHAVARLEQTQSSGSGSGSGSAVPASLVARSSRAASAHSTVEAEDSLDGAVLTMLRHRPLN